jgi:hypothetical protein
MTRTYQATVIGERTRSPQAPGPLIDARDVENTAVLAAAMPAALVYVRARYIA